VIAEFRSFPGVVCLRCGMIPVSSRIGEIQDDDIAEGKSGRAQESDRILCGVVAASSNPGGDQISC